jgi:hypothetical protein
MMMMMMMMMKEFCDAFSDIEQLTAFRRVGLTAERSLLPMKLFRDS